MCFGKLIKCLEVPPALVRKRMGKGHSSIILMQTLKIAFVLRLTSVVTNHIYLDVLTDIVNILCQKTRWSQICKMANQNTTTTNQSL